MKYKVTLNGRTYEVEVEAGKAMHPKNEFTHSLSALLPNGQDEIVNTEGGPSVPVRFCASR